MKKLLSVRALALLLVSIMTLSLFSCSQPTYDVPKSFSYKGLDITLTEDFKMENPPENFTGYFSSQKAIVMTIFESDKALSDAGYETGFTLDEYTDEVAGDNEYSVFEGTDMMSFSYERSVDYKTYYYLALTVRGNEGFWLVQFACDKKDKDYLAPLFDTWAKSIKCE